MPLNTPNLSMLQRFAARGRTLRQAALAARNRSNHPFTTLIKTGAATHPARDTAQAWGGADCIHRPRAMMSSDARDPLDDWGTATYLDYSGNRDIDFDLIESRMTCSKFHDAAWGFVIYRCAQGNDTAWDRLLYLLRGNLQRALKFYIREDMLDFHRLHIIDDKTLYGATSHQVREHFQSWVTKNLEDRLRPDAINPDDDIGWIHATSTPRYKYCLFADDICLESVDYPSSDSPVVKILLKDWTNPYAPDERNYTVHPPYHDGATDDWEEDVGWMYMPVDTYLGRYELLSRHDWDTQYVRPPYMDWTETEDTFIGHWRKNR